MLRRAAFLTMLIATSAVHPFALAQQQQQPTEGDGGLHVSGGGMIGSVGGSISGTVRGPGVGGGVQAPVHEEAVRPNAIEGGSIILARVEIPNSAPVSAPAPSAGPLGPILAISLVAITAAVLFLRPVRQPR